MKPSNRQDAPKGPERIQPKQEPDAGEAQRERLEKERKIQSPETESSPDPEQGKGDDPSKDDSASFDE